MVSIITINYNGWRDTCALVDSFLAHETYPYEFIVVDNASDGEDVAMISKLCPTVRLISSTRNLGFAGGNNLGYTYAEGEYIFFLNNDMLIETPVLESLVSCLQKETIAGVSPTVRYLGDKKNVQYFGCRKLSPLTLKFRTSAFDYNHPDKCLVSAETDVMYGGAMMVRRDVIEKVGQMAEVYFLFAEEFDWSYRITESGYRLWYEADTVIYHKGGGTISYGSPLRTYYMSRARLLFARRNSDNGLVKCLSCFYLSAISMPKNFCRALLRRNWCECFALLRGTWHGLVDNKNIKKKES